MSVLPFWGRLEDEPEDDTERLFLLQPWPFFLQTSVQALRLHTGQGHFRRGRQFGQIGWIPGSKIINSFPKNSNKFHRTHFQNATKIYVGVILGLPATFGGGDPLQTRHATTGNYVLFDNRQAEPPTVQTSPTYRGINLNGTQTLHVKTSGNPRVLLLCGYSEYHWRPEQTFFICGRRLFQLFSVMETPGRRTEVYQQLFYKGELRHLLGDNFTLYNKRPPAGTERQVMYRHLKNTSLKCNKYSRGLCTRGVCSLST